MDGGAKIEEQAGVKEECKEGLPAEQAGEVEKKAEDKTTASLSDTRYFMNSCALITYAERPTEVIKVGQNQA